MRYVAVGHGERFAGLLRCAEFGGLEERRRVAAWYRALIERNLGMELSLSAIDGSERVPYEVREVPCSP